MVWGVNREGTYLYDTRLSSASLHPAHVRVALRFQISQALVEYPDAARSVYLVGTSRGVSGFRS